MMRKADSYIFETFLEIAPPSSETTDGFILQKYPSHYHNEVVLASAVRFAFPIAKSLFNPECHSQELEYGGGIEHYTFVLTDGEHNFKYGYCRRFMNNSSTCLCLISLHPWFDVFRRLMNKLGDLINRTSDWNILESMLYSINQQDLTTFSIGSEIQSVVKDNLHENFSFHLPDKYELPRMPTNQNLNEYYSAVSADSMILIFISLLMERRVLIISRRLSRLTACVHASAALLYPLKWQHIFIPVLTEDAIDYCSAPMPYLIGLHASLLARIAGSKIVHLDKIDKETQSRIDAILDKPVIVNADSGEVTSTHNDIENFPPDIINELRKGLTVNKGIMCGDGVSRSFLRTMASIIGCYKNYIKKSDANDSLQFDKDLFLSEGNKTLRSNLVQLQSFDVFIDDRLKALTKELKEDNDIDEDSKLELAEFWREFEIESHISSNKNNFKKFAKVTLQMKNKVKSSGKRVVKDVKNRMDDNFARKTFNIESLTSPISPEAMNRISSQHNTRKYNIITELTHQSSQEEADIDLPSQRTSGIEGDTSKLNRISTMSILSDPDIQRILNRKNISYEQLTDSADDYTDDRIIMKADSVVMHKRKVDPVVMHKRKVEEPYSSRDISPLIDFSATDTHTSGSTSKSKPPPPPPPKPVHLRNTPRTEDPLPLTPVSPMTTANPFASHFTYSEVNTPRASGTFQPSSSSLPSHPSRYDDYIMSSSNTNIHRSTIADIPITHYPLTPPDVDSNLPTPFPRKSKKIKPLISDLIEGFNTLPVDPSLSAIEQFDPLLKVTDTSNSRVDGIIRDPTIPKRPISFAERTPTSIAPVLPPRLTRNHVNRDAVTTAKGKSQTWTTFE